ncbi:MAG: hypothetical protein ACJAWV_003431 [Flammeovirgaceae bacterium]|jgi:hypothetical protein
MFRYIYIILFFFSLSFVSYSQEIKFKKRKLGENVATISIPEGFVPMMEEEMKQEFVMFNRPIAAYKSLRNPGILSVSQSITQWNPEDAEMFKAFYKSTIIGIHSEVRFIQEEIRDIGGEPYVIFEFVASVKAVRSTIVDKGALKKYNYVQYSIKNGKLIGFNFSSPFNYKSRWEKQVRQMMDSAEVK